MDVHTSNYIGRQADNNSCRKDWKLLFIKYAIAPKNHMKSAEMLNNKWINRQFIGIIVLKSVALF